MSQILIIDDDPTMRLTLSRSLKNQGYEVVLAADGGEGLRMAKSLHPSLIICDWMMPVIDGLEVCRSVKATPELANTYFILLTARDQEGDLVQGFETGADDFLAKPPRINELKARVRAGLRLYQANHDLQLQKQLLENELSQAAEYVRSLLPPDLEDDVSIHSCFLPSTQLGGDCFDYYWLDDENFVVYLLDVSGHGVGSALLSVSVLNLLRTRGLRSRTHPLEATNFRKPSEVLSDLNTNFQMSDHQEMYFTIWYGVYNKNTRRLTYASGGHPPAILINPDSSQAEPRSDDRLVQQLKTFGLPIGMMPDVEYEEAFCDITVGSSLYIFSDGAYEIPLEDDSIWGIDALVDALLRFPVGLQPPDGENSPIDYALSCAKKVNKTGQHNLDDDLSLLEVRFVR
ncbi:SpoIIE family protein phosphatase [Tumidithrix helvetica PCC 7403]|uniref:PP2C family protein-serine/threonine phosphatase n=1 Tax=Tumidithrix helvetica TaxID=3457545 RepID=UPI003C9F2A6A